MQAIEPIAIEAVAAGAAITRVNNTLVNCPNAIKLFDHPDRITPPYCLSPTSGKATLANNIIWNSTPAFNLAGTAFGSLYVNVSFCDIQGGTNNASARPRCEAASFSAGLSCAALRPSPSGMNTGS